MSLDYIVLNEISQSQKDTYYDSSYMMFLEQLNSET